MIASEIYAVLSKHGLTPPIHFLAAPHEWRTAMDEIEELFEQQAYALFGEPRESTNTGGSLLEALEAIKK